MNLVWSAEQISSFAPDESSRRACRRIAGPDKWLALGSTSEIVWGEFPVKDKPPIQTAVLLTEPVFTCSCGNRRVPCDHALGLVLLWFEDPAWFRSSSLPEWAQEQLDEIPSFEQITSPAISSQDHADKLKTRDAALQRGLLEFELWLHDLVRNGLADLQQRPKSTWTQMAERLVDAGAGELAREVRRLAEIPDSSANWPEHLLGRIGALYLLIQGMKRLDSLPPETQADLRAAVGWQPRPDTYSPDRIVRDRWHIVSSQLVQEGRQRVQRTWLWGENHNRAALILQRSHRSANLDMRLVTGSVLDADVQYFPSSIPIRAQIERRHERAQPVTAPAGYDSVEQAVATYSDAVSVNPWVGAFPVLLRSVIATPNENNWILIDSMRRAMPLPAKHPHLWHLRALTRYGDTPVFGEWNGEILRPLSLWADGRWIELRTLQGTV